MKSLSYVILMSFALSFQGCDNPKLKPPRPNDADEESARSIQEQAIDREFARELAKEFGKEFAKEFARQIKEGDFPLDLKIDS